MGRSRVGVGVAIAVALATSLAVPLAVPAAAVAATPSPTASPSPGPEGVSVTPVPGDKYASASGTHLELGLVQPGTPVDDKVRVVNIGSDPMTVDLYAADAIPAYNGGFGFTAKSEPTHAVGQWITLAASRLQLPGHSVSTVPFKLVVPQGAAGGEHVGGIIAEPVTTSDGGGVQTKTRFAMAVYLRTPGSPATPTPPPPVGPGDKPSPTVTVTKLTADPEGRDVCLKLRYTNYTSDVIDPAAHVTVSSSWGLGAKRFTVEKLGAVLPGSTATVTLPCAHGVAPGRDHVTVELTSPQGTTTVTKDLFVTAWPLFLALLFLLILLVLIGLELWRRKRARERELAQLRAAVSAREAG